MRKVFGRSHKRLVRFSLLTANLALLAAVVFFVTKAPAKPAAQLNATASPITADVVTGPLDQVSSADIAVHVARIVNLPEKTSVVNNADSMTAQLARSEANTSVVSKPQLVSSALPTYKDIQEYTTVAGDTVASIATRFGVSSDSVKWSNSLTSNLVPAGRTLFLPPAGTNGIIYTVSSGDTPDSIAKKYSADKDLIISFNDAELSGFKPGQRIFVPDGTITVVAAPIYYTFFGGGGYDKGWCTDYASAKGGAPGGWGNANTWAYFAARTPGWTVSSAPRVGAIAQTTRGWAGHVGIVDAVSEDGTMIKYSDMNGLAGWGRVGYSGWVPVHSQFENFIYRQ